MSEVRSESGSILAEFRRLGLDPPSTDAALLEWMRQDCEETMAALRTDPAFAAALPAPSAWPELRWPRDEDRS